MIPLDALEMNDQAFYDVVAGELQNRDIHPGLWARAVAETSDTGDVARAAYIRLRVADLIAAAQAEKRQQAAEERSRKVEAFRRFTKDYVVGAAFLLVLLGIALWFFLFVV